ncbi:pilus assembly protein TadE [Bifidobacterium animalis subsp. animalis MCC 0483]|uniref:Pilus assembly protein TadE n=1 Tax=Bifidobacterium animalis subsp. animalis MCC 0483 TaxID=1365955 RepID=A0AB34TAR8_9BIFI|nr:TadE/TadG family type IV pilus assembly protein [Bifidobacterium animalis]ANU43506.1 pilus assembly protein TadE [Bifidobacterium animalis subsp. animalis]KOA51172.1 pilus assembly protein TadE [Bifidobacterium animalis subsp. animalis MCC 0483]KOA56679.1 pilus assembly protein TadE [Bifidobacterium animalis subsp. animalis ATCC 27672]PHQ54111.1 pilus assembly protein TadE [Bifidobacterium animalis subsp. animalis]QQQ89730.1 pilus assembly protein [Bifidobacterium animalis]
MSGHAFGHALRHLQRDDEGTATAEFAVVLPVIVVLAALLLYLGRASVVSVGCQDAAANAARALMVAGNALESGSQAVAQTAAGDGVRIQVRTAGNGFEVIAHCAVVADPWGVVPRTVTGRAHGIWQEES